MLADMAYMPRSALPAIDLDAKEDASLSALLSRGTFIFEGIGKPLQLSLILAFAYLSVSCRAMTLIEGFLAAAAHEDARVIPSMAPLVLPRLLSRMSLPLLT